MKFHHPCSPPAPQYKAKPDESKAFAVIENPSRPHLCRQRQTLGLRWCPVLWPCVYFQSWKFHLCLHLAPRGCSSASHTAMHIHFPNWICYMGFYFSFFMGWWEAGLLISLVNYMLSTELQGKEQRLILGIM
ncbi:unnamed protein product [Prunus armeniaca]|uniref:Uncharacterized protein n=1 Tax=Prunus armeniaca TaxID=36596 RepID=A0A6J5VM58_PRUAR|nr:unnamed protein product [Prunus armeniaca]